MLIKFLKTHPDAILPKRNHDTDTGYDVFVVEDAWIPAHGSTNVATGIEVAYIEHGYWFKVECRSGLSFKHGIQSHPGIIDEMYTGSLSILLRNYSNIGYQVKKGDKVAQIVVYKREDAVIEWATEKHQTTRGDKGLGSSGR